MEIYDPAEFCKPVQLELFDNAVIKLPPCGRRGPCEAIYETSTTGGYLRCRSCDCIAPLAKRNGTIFDGFMQSQLRRILAQQESAPDGLRQFDER